MSFPKKFGMTVCVSFVLATLVPCPGSAQGDDPDSPCSEIFVRTKNTGGSSYTFTAETTDDPRWNPGFYLTSGYTSSSFQITGDYSGCDRAWDFNDDCATPDLGHNLYKISVSPGSAYFYADAYGSIFQGDLHVVYDAQSAKFLLSGNCGDLTGSEITNGTTFTLYSGGYGVFQPTNPSNLSVSASGGHPYLTWSVSTPSVAKYNVYQSRSKFGTYTKLNGSPISPTNYSDHALVMSEAGSFFC